MKNGKEKERKSSWLQCDNQDRVDVRAVIILALAAVLALLIFGLAMGESNRKKVENAGKDFLVEESGQNGAITDISDDSIHEGTEGGNSDKQKKLGGKELDGNGLSVPGRGNIVIDSRQKDMKAKEEALPDLSDRFICFAGYEDCSVGEGERMALVNLAENEDIYIAYTVYLADTGEAVFETDLIAPGNSVEWTVGEDLEPGEHRISLYQVPYIRDNHGNFVELISASNEMTIFVE